MHQKRTVKNVIFKNKDTAIVKPTKIFLGILVNSFLEIAFSFILSNKICIELLGPTFLGDLIFH